MELSISVWSNQYINSLSPIEYTVSNNIIKSEVFGATKSNKCLTCKQTLDVCQGHWGRIELPEPIVRPSFKTIINTILGKLCLHCGIKIHITKEEFKILSSTYPFTSIQTREYIQLVARLKKSSDATTKCRRCGTVPHKLKITEGTFSDGTNVVSHSNIYRLMKSIPYSLYPIFTNVNFPLTDLFFESYPLSPLYLRFGVEYNGLVVDSYISKLYQELIAILSSFNTPFIQRIIDELELNDNNAPNSSFGRPFIGKYTLFRSLINSYSGNKTIRNVLNVNTSASPDIGYFCREFYKTLTCKIYMNKYTMKIINNLKGNIKYAMNAGRFLKIKIPTMLEPGDFVEVLVENAVTQGMYPNMISYRQPALHKYSLVAQIIKPTVYTPTNGNSSTLSTTVITGMNGDQDGDEFNSRMIESITAQYEHRFIMRPRANMINDSTGSLAYGLIQTEVLQFIKIVARHGREWYKNLLPNCLRDAKFETNTSEEIMASKKSRNLIKNIIQLSSPKDGYLFFYNLVNIVKSRLGREKMAFMTREIVDAQDFILKVRQKKNTDLTIFQEDIIKMNANKIPITVNFINERIATMNASYEKEFKSWLESLDILTNDYALISYGNLKVNPKMLSETLLLQRSENIQTPTNYYLNRPSSIYNINSLDLGAYGIITDCLFNGLDFKNLMHTFASARKKIIITSVMTALPGMISRDMCKTMEDMYIHFTKFSVIYRQVIDLSCNIYKLPISQLYIIPVEGRKRPMLFPLDIPFILDNLHTLYPDKDKNILTTAKQQELIKTFAYSITERYMYSFGCIHLYIIEVFNTLPLMTQRRLEYFFKLLENKYKLYPAIGEPIGVNISTTIGEILTQSSLSNFHTVKKGGEEITLDSDAINFNLIKFSYSKKSHIIQLMCDDVSKLYSIRRYFEYVSLDDLGLDIQYIKSNGKERHITMQVLRNKVTDKSLFMSDLEDLIANYINEISYIKRCDLELFLMKYHIGIKMTVQLINDTTEISSSLVMLLRNICKGSYSCSMKKDILLIECTSMDFLSQADTTDITIKPSPEITTTFMSPVNSYQSLIDSYSTSGMNWLAYRNLAMFQTRYGFPIGIRKYPTTGQPLISKMSHQRAYLDMQKSAAIREEQLPCVASSILFNEPVKLGTGFFNVSLDVGNYVTAKNIKKEEKVDTIIL